MITVPCPTPPGTLRLALLVAADDPAARAALPCGADLLVLALDGPDAPLPATAPDAVLLRDARSGRDVAALGARLAVHEAERDWPDGGLRILAEIHHPLGVLDARSFAGASPRLAGLGLDGAGLAAILGAEAGGETLSHARAHLRLAAAAAGVTAFATVGPEGPERALAAARREGIGLLIARDPGEAALLRAGL